MAKFKKIQLPCSVSGGKLVIDRELLNGKLSTSVDQDGCTLTISPPRNAKTLKQIKTFYGPVLEQVQKFYEDTEGISIPKDRIKHMLKTRFLTPVKRYFADGTPVTTRVRHPEKEGIYFEAQLEEIPSLGDLSLEEFTAFISEIIHFFYHEKGFLIVIDDRMN